MLPFIFIIVLILFSFLMYTYNQNKLLEQRRQIVMLTQNNSILKSKLNSFSDTPKNIRIIYTEEGNSELTLSEDAILLLSPMNGAIKIKQITKGTTVKLLVSARVSLSGAFEELWYEVVVPSQSSINNRGWIKSHTITKLD